MNPYKNCTFNIIKLDIEEGIIGKCVEYNYYLANYLFSSLIESFFITKVAFSPTFRDKFEMALF